MIFLKPGQTLEQWLQEKLNSLTLKEATPQRAANVTRLELDGQVVDGLRATLEAVIVIQVLDDKDLVNVPLRLSEATIIGEVDHEGPGVAFPGKAGGNDGYTWWLQGKGEHRLKLKLSVPIESHPPKTRLQLSLPPAAVSELKLRVPQANVTAEILSKDPFARPVISKIEGSEISFSGLGTSSDISWKPLISTDKSKLALEVDNTIFVDFDDAAVFVKARQQIFAIDGTGMVEELIIDLPQNSNLLSLQGPDVKSHAFDAENPERLRIHLAEPTKGPVELSWNIELVNSTSGANVDLEGFHVEGAVRENGLIGLRTKSDHRLSVDVANQKYVRRINVADAKKQFPDTPAAVFRFHKQPFKLSAASLKVQPQYTVSPQLMLNVTAISMEFEGIFQYRVTGGELSEVLRRRACCDH